MSLWCRNVKFKIIKASFKESYSESSPGEGHIYVKVLLSSGKYYEFYDIPSNKDISSYKLTENKHLLPDYNQNFDI